MSKSVAVAALSVLALAACGSESTVTGSPGGTTLAANDRERAVPAADAPVGEAARGLQTFGYELIRDNPELVEDGNLVVSPASIGAAFAMAVLGRAAIPPRRSTPCCIFPPTGSVTRTTLSPGAGRAGAARMHPTSASRTVFAQRSFALEPDYLAALARDFGAGVQRVDSADGSAAELINAWVKTETRDRIDKLFEELDPATVLVLANAVYLKATWERNFLADLTRPMPFRRADGSLVRPETMSHHEPEKYEHAATDDWAAARIPYVGNELAMRALLPTARDGDPVALLDPAVLSAAQDRSRYQRVDLSLPKWDFQSIVPLNAPLMQLGMSVPFSAAADFSGISPRAPWIDQVMHRADITVDENGTEAAAVTGIASRTSAGPRANVSMTVDHPFAFVIVHEPSGAPLFEDVIGDPAATQ